jgi:O-6-methylguanine DNA methyltransferase
MPLTRNDMIAAMRTPDGSMDGTFFIGVKTTGIYCLPSCRPARSPKPENVEFYATPEEARAAGLRACKLCHPDAVAPRGIEIERPVAYVDTIEEPPGPFAFAVNGDGALLWLQFLDGAYRRSIEEGVARAGYVPAFDPARTAAARTELLEYCRGDRVTFSLPLVLKGTDWQIAVWQALTRIPLGETRTYGQIAAELGRPGAARAMGRANATNHIPLVVPCHRVIGANGELTGFEGGLHIKSRLLEHEARVRQA